MNSNGKVLVRHFKSCSQLLDLLNKRNWWGWEQCKGWMNEWIKETERWRENWAKKEQQSKGILFPLVAFPFQPLFCSVLCCTAVIRTFSYLSIVSIQQARSLLWIFIIKIVVLVMLWFSFLISSEIFSHCGARNIFTSYLRRPHLTFHHSNSMTCLCWINWNVVVKLQMNSLWNTRSAQLN